MIKNSLITFVLIFVGFSAFLFFNKKEWQSSQYQYQDNIIRTEKYLYNKSTSDTVIVGTSLSARLPTDSLQGVYNLALAGLSAYDGLFIITEKEPKPRAVFIEINYFLKQEDKVFISSFDSKLNNSVKQHVPAWRDENQPVGIMMHFFRSAHKTAAPGQSGHEKNVIPADVFTELLDRHIKEYNKLDTVLLRTSTDRLYKYVHDLTTQGSKVCFFEMPVNPALENLPLATASRNSIAERFRSEKNVFFIERPLNYSYNTTDGIHLDDDGLYNYILYLRNAIRKLPL